MTTRCILLSVTRYINYLARYNMLFVMLHTIECIQIRVAVVLKITDYFFRQFSTYAAP